MSPDFVKGFETALVCTMPVLVWLHVSQRQTNRDIRRLRCEIDEIIKEETVPVDCIEPIKDDVGRHAADFSPVGPGRVEQ